MYVLKDEVYFLIFDDDDNFSQSSGKIIKDVLWMMTTPHPEGSSSHFRYQKISTIDKEHDYSSGSGCIQLGRKI